MFDFENTPITEYTKLKAQYSCEPTPVLSYDGDWLRVTLTNGTVLEAQNQTEVNSVLAFMYSDFSTTINGQTVQGLDVAKLEFGTKVTSIPDEAMNMQAYPNLKSISGFHEGLQTIGRYCLLGSWMPSPTMTSTIVFPSTLTAVDTDGGFLHNNNYFCGTLVINCPPEVFYKSDSIWSEAFLSNGSWGPFYTEGIKVTGAYAAEFMERFPNRNEDSAYRNLYNGNTLEGLVEAIRGDNASTLYPAGTEIPDLYDGASNPLIVAQHLDSTNNSAYDGAEGVILIRKYPVATSQQFNTTATDDIYSTSLMNEYLSTTYANNCSEELKAVVGDITLANSASSNPADTTTAKHFLMSTTEVGGSIDANTKDSGIFWEYWKNKTGLSSPTIGATPGRVIYDKAGTAARYWLRTRNISSHTVGLCNANGYISYAQTNLSFAVVPACFIPKGGNNGTA